MALNYNNRYPSQTDVDLQYYPYGKARNISNEVLDDGTPFERDYINDQFGFFQKILKESGIAPNGSVDNAVSSQYYNALTNIITNTTYADTENLVAGITTRVDNLQGDLSDSQLLLTSTIDELGVVSSRAYLGVSDTIDGKTNVTGVVFDTQTRGIRFSGDIFELTKSSGESALAYNATSNEWVFSGRLVVGDNYEINSEADIRALDGKDGQTISSFVEYPFLGSNDGWGMYALTETLTPSYLNVVSTSNDAYLFRDSLNIKGASENIVSLRVRNKLPQDTTSTMSVYYKTATHEWNEGFKKTLPEVKLTSNEWATVIFDMRELTAGGTDWIDNDITNIRINLVDTVGADLDIDNISIGHYGAAISGQSGAGFYGSLYANIDWTLAEANLRFTTLVGRPPVQYDIFTQTKSDGTASESRSYKQGEWVAPSLLVNGDLIATGTVAGDRFIAGTEISAPVINGGILRGAKVEMIGSNFMKLSSATPFGPNNLIEWFGERSGKLLPDNTPDYTKITKVSAITYLGDDGSAYFGGTIIAGSLTTSKQNPSTGGIVEVSTGSFGSNGGQIAVACGFTYNLSALSSGTCPSPAPSAPTVELKLYQIVSGSEVLRQTQSYTGSYSCAQESGEYVESFNITGSFTYYDNDNTIGDRNYILRATRSGDTPDSQSLSIVTQEA